jgi:hypothetical protein
MLPRLGLYRLLACLPEPEPVGCVHLVERMAARVARRNACGYSGLPDLCLS